MRFATFIITLFFLAAGSVSNAQRIIYSQPGNDDTRRMNFEVIGKVSGSFLIYKNSLPALPAKRLAVSSMNRTGSGSMRCPA